MSTQRKPDWIPNWQKKEEYPGPATTSARQWAWEFLRRSPHSRQAKGKLSMADIKKGGHSPPKKLPNPAALHI